MTERTSSTTFNEEKITNAFHRFFLKYFLAGQVTEKDLINSEVSARRISNEDVTFIDRHRNKIGVIVPMLVVNAAWWAYMVSDDKLGLFESKGDGDKYPRWYMSVTMLFGSLLAGATSEGGGAVAFPIMTLFFSISPTTARDFSLMIQSVGMVSASLAILWMKILVEWKAIAYISIGALCGIIFGLEEIHLSAPYAKMYFAVIWSAFAFSLYLLNRVHGRHVYLVLDPVDTEPHIWESGVIYKTTVAGVDCIVNWKVIVLLLTGFVGGVFTSIAGTGVDICSFAVLTILFRISEKTATPTSVILMAINSVVGLIYRQWIMHGVESDAWNYWLVCVPIVCVGAPVGGLLSSYSHRLVLAAAVYILTTAQLVSATVLIEPWKKQKGTLSTPLILTTTSIAMFCFAIGCFLLLQELGKRLLDNNMRLSPLPTSASKLIL